MPTVSHVPRPQNPFILYRSWLKTIGATPTAADLKKYRTASKWAGEKWNAEDKVTKEIFYHRAKEEKRQHALKYPNYVYQPRRNARRKEKGKEEPIRVFKLNTKGKQVKREKTHDMPGLATLPVPLALSSSFDPLTPIGEADIMLPTIPFVPLMVQPLEFEHVMNRSSDIERAYLIILSQYPGSATAFPIAYTELDGEVVQDPSFSLTRTDDNNSMPASALCDVVSLADGHFDVKGSEDELSTSFNDEICPREKYSMATEKSAYEDMFMGVSGSRNLEYNGQYPFPVYDWNGEGAADIIDVPTAAFNCFNNIPFDGLPFTGL